MIDYENRVIFAFDLVEHGGAQSWGKTVRDTGACVFDCLMKDGGNGHQLPTQDQGLAEKAGKYDTESHACSREERDPEYDARADCPPVDFVRHTVDVRQHFPDAVQHGGFHRRRQLRGN